jgi:hypothetical protein
VTVGAVYERALEFGHLSDGLALADSRLRLEFWVSPRCA